jgi:hypothetical protein
VAYLHRHQPRIEGQREVADRIGVSLEPSDTIGDSAARLQDALIDVTQPRNRWTKSPRHNKPSIEQVELAQSIGADLGGV